jgi:hypothetical protein
LAKVIVTFRAWATAKPPTTLAIVSLPDPRCKWLDVRFGDAPRGAVLALGPDAARLLKVQHNTEAAKAAQRDPPDGELPVHTTGRGTRHDRPLAGRWSGRRRRDEQHEAAEYG